MALQLNQFNQSNVLGALTLALNHNTISAIIHSSSAGSLPPGQAVKLVDEAGGQFSVVECSADTDDVFGFLEYDIKQQSFSAGERVNVSAFRGNVMIMTASAAIARNAKVMIVVASDKVATATSGKTIIGRALDKASADGDLIRVLIDLPGSAA